MKRILIAEAHQEIASFNPLLSDLSRFRISKPNELFAEHANSRWEVAGALDVFRERSDIDTIPGFGCHAVTAGGITTAETWHFLAENFLDSVREAGKLDGIYFTLHGAMAAVDELEVDGYLLRETRKIVGEEIPIVASFDLHGILTNEILKHCNAVTVYHTYPHVDQFATGQRSAKILLDILDGKVNPVMVRARIPALVRGDELQTKSGVFGDLVAQTIAIEDSEVGVSGGIFIGNPFTDVPDLASSVIICTNDDEGLAVRSATKIAQEFWDLRQKMQAHLTPLKEAVAIACNEKVGTTILVDAADATSSGASGDSNAVLAELMSQKYPRTALIPIVDAPAAEKAIKVGVGGTLKCFIGGTVDPRFKPIEISGTVRMLSDGHVINEAEKEPWPAGNCAVVQVGNLTIVITSKPVNLHNRSLFFAHGLFPENFDLVLVKSPHCQHHMYKSWATTYINVDAPGSTSANLPSLGHKVCRRPVFPLDTNFDYVPEISVFRR
jgi:microcystin degradation protein MlrC